MPRLTRPNSTVFMHRVKLDRRTAILAGASSCLATLLPGCSVWRDSVAQDVSEKEPRRLAKLPAGHVAVDVALVRIEPDEVRRLTELWPALGENAIELSRRQQLERNGIRCGVATGSLPMPVTGWVERSERKLEDDPLEKADLAADVSSVPKSLIFPSGQTRELEIRVIPEQVRLLYWDGTPKGQLLDDPRMTLKLTATSREDGLIDVEVRPQIEHGRYKNQLIGNATAMRRQVTRDLLEWPQLTITRSIPAGQTLLVAATDPPLSIGELFFTTHLADTQTRPTLLLLRFSAA